MYVYIKCFTSHLFHYSYISNFISIVFIFVDFFLSKSSILRYFKGSDFIRISITLHLAPHILCYTYIFIILVDFFVPKANYFRAFERDHCRRKIIPKMTRTEITFEIKFSSNFRLTSTLSVFCMVKMQMKIHFRINHSLAFGRRFQNHPRVLPVSVNDVANESIVRERVVKFNARP